MSKECIDLLKKILLIDKNEKRFKIYYKEWLGYNFTNILILKMLKEFKNN